MVEITELNREPASTVSTLTATTEITTPSVDATDVTSDTLTATTEVTSPSVTADALKATRVLNAPKYPTRSDVPDKEGIYRVSDVDGEGNFGIIAREI